MGRKNLYEVLENVGLRPSIEYKRLMALFFENKSIVFYGTIISLADFIETSYFYSNPVRGSATNFKELFVDMNLPNATNRIEVLFLLCELLLAFDPSRHIFNVENQTIRNSIYDQFNKIKTNIDIVCQRSNHEIVNNKGKRIIVEKNKLTSHAVELVDDPVLDLAMIEYNHFALKGHLEEKKKILCQIGNYIEPMLKSREMEKTEYKQLQSDAGFLLNHFHIRHNNKEGKKTQEYILSLADDQLEEWYDKAYNTLLSVIICNEQISISKELKQLKQEYNWIS